MGFLAVAFGAFGAHALRDRIAPELLTVYQTGAAYHLAHAVALLAVALFGRATRQSVTLTAGSFVAGIVLFSGSLYLMALTGERRLGMVTPFGGVSFLIGWGSCIWRLARSADGAPGASPRA